MVILRMTPVGGLNELKSTARLASFLWNLFERTQQISGADVIPVHITDREPAKYKYTTNSHLIPIEKMQQKII